MDDFKICAQCHQQVESSVNFCPHCASATFQEMPVGDTNPPQTDSVPDGQGTETQPPVAAQQQPVTAQQSPVGVQQSPVGVQPPVAGGVNGDPQYAQPAYGYQAPASNQYYAPSPLAQHSMKWFKFLIYFALFCAALFNFVYGVQYITGGIYQSQAGVSADMVYAVFEELKAADVIYGLLLIAMAAFNIYTRFSLAGYKKIGPTCVYVTYVANAVLSLLYSVAASAIIGESFDVSAVSRVIVSTVILALNYTYFTKRQYLFVN